MNKYKDLILSIYKGKKIAILGYRDNGAQQRAKFLKENGIEVVVGLRVEDEYWEVAKQDGFEVYPAWKAAEQADIAQVW